jgi:uncharacterized protein YggE
MNRRTAAAVVLAIGASSIAYAQTSPDAGPHASPGMLTHLHLSAEGSVSVPPDELVAMLVAEAQAAATSAAQHQVNELMAGGLKEARGIAGVEARAIGYSVRMVDLNTPAVPDVRPAPQRPGWIAEQTLELRSNAGEQLLDLMGKLQGAGFATAGLNWQLSPTLGRHARDTAMQEALKALQARAAAAAAVLGLRVDHLQDVQVDMPEVVPIRPMMAMAAKAGPPPEATAAPQAVTSDVSADVVLRP